MRFILASAALLALPACGSPSPEPVTVENVWVQLPVLPGRPGSAYFTLRSDNDPTRLVSVTSPQVERVELHEVRMEGNVSRMGPARDLTFAEELEFKPGGKHAMLFGIDPAVKPGSKLTLTFTFEPAPPATVEAEVRSVGGHSAH